MLLMGLVTGHGPGAELLQIGVVKNPRLPGVGSESLWKEAG